MGRGPLWRGEGGISVLWESPTCAPFLPPSRSVGSALLSSPLVRGKGPLWRGCLCALGVPHLHPLLPPSRSVGRCVIELTLGARGEATVSSRGAIAAVALQTLRATAQRPTLTRRPALMPSTCVPTPQGHGVRHHRVLPVCVPPEPGCQ